MSTMLRALLVLFLVAGNLACASSWRVDPAGPVATVTERRPVSVRVTTADSSRIVVTKPVMRGDTVRGHTYSAVSGSLRPIAIPVGSITLLEYRHSSGGNTVLLVGLGLLAAAVIGLAAGGGPPSSLGF